MTAEVIKLAGRGGAMNPHSEESFRAALFTEGWYDLRPATAFTDMSRDWADPANLPSIAEIRDPSSWVTRVQLAVV